MRVFFFPSWYPTDKHPQNGNFIIEHAKAVALHHEVFYFTFETSESVAQPITTEKFENFTWVKGYYRNHPLGIVRWYRKFQVLKYAVRQLQPFDVLHLHVLTLWYVPLLYLSKKYGIPLLVTEHWTRYFHSPKFSQSWWELKFIRFFAPKRQVCTTVSHALADAMRTFFPSWKFYVVPNVIDVETFSKYSHLPEDNLTLLHVSSLQDWQKGVHEIIEVFLELKEEYPQLQLILIGGMPDERMQQLIKKCSDSTAIQILGMLPPGEVAQWMSQSSVLVMNSRYETFCKVLYEAAVVGLPIIAPDLPAIKEFFLPEMGILFPSGNRKALKKVIQDFIQHPFSTSSQTYYIEKLFGREVIANHFNEVYQFAVSERRIKK